MSTTMLDPTAVRRPRAAPEAWEVAVATQRMIRAVGRRCAEEDPEQLLHLRELEAELNAAWRTAIDGLREHQFSDYQIAEALGVSQPAVSMRWKREPGAGR